MNLHIYKIYQPIRIHKYRRQPTHTIARKDHCAPETERTIHCTHTRSVAVSKGVDVSAAQSASLGDYQSTAHLYTVSTWACVREVAEQSTRRFVDHSIVHYNHIGLALHVSVRMYARDVCVFWFHFMRCDTCWAHATQFFRSNWIQVCKSEKNKRTNERNETTTFAVWPLVGATCRWHRHQQWQTRLRTYTWVV